MADSTVEVVVRGSGFDQLATQAEKAGAAIRNLGAAVRGTNAAGSAAAKATADVMKGVNGTALGTTLGNQIRSSMANALGNSSFWNSTFSSLGSRFKQFGTTIGRSVQEGFNGAVQNIRNMNGGNGPSHTDLIGGAVIGGLAFKGIEDLVHAAAERQGAMFRLAATGKTTSTQRQALEGLAGDWSKQFGNLSTTEGLDFLKDSLQIFGGTEEIFGDHGKSDQISAEGREAMTRIAGLMSYSKAYQAATGKEGNPEAIIGQFASAIRSGEIKGLGSNPIDLANWVEKLTKIQLATGVDPTTFLQAQRAAGLSFLTMNDDAIYKFAAMVQENKQRAGVMAATSFMHMVAGGSQTMRGNEAMRSLGLFGDEATIKANTEKGLIETNKKGQITHIDPTLIPNGNDFAKDQYKWYAETLYPAIRAKILKKDGVDIGDTSKTPSQRTLDDVANIMRELGAAFKNRNEATQAAESLVQAPQLEKRTANARKAQIDLDAANELVVKNTQDFSAAMQDLEVDLGKTVLPTVTGFLKRLSGVIRDFGVFAKNHPDLTGGILKYGLGATLAGGTLAGAGLFLSFMKLPLEILKSVGIFAASITTGAGIGLFDLAGGAAAAGKLGQTAKNLEQWVAASGMIGKIMGTVGRLMSVFGTIFGAVELAKWAASTQTGSAIIDAVEKDATRWWHGDKATNFEKYQALDARWRSNRTIDSNLGHPEWAGAPPSYIDQVLSGREKWLDMSRNHGWMQHIKPPEQSWYHNSGGGSRFRQPNQANGAAPSGPIPVVVQSMPKGQDRPNNVTTNVTVNVQTNASPQAIGGAVGSAVESKLHNMLGDYHDR